MKYCYINHRQHKCGKILCFPQSELVAQYITLSNMYFVLLSETSEGIHQDQGTEQGLE